MDCSTQGFVGESEITLSPANPTYPYVNSATKVVLYPAATSYFTNSNGGVCGGFTNCEILPSGCSGTYSGKLTITSAGEISAEQNVAPGYTETNCVKCYNSAGHSI